MNITPKRATAIVNRFEELKNIAKDFVRSKNQNGRLGDVHISYDLSIEEYVNTACHCHPECKWVKKGTGEEFCEWLNKINIS